MAIFRLGFETGWLCVVIVPFGAAAGKWSVANVPRRIDAGEVPGWQRVVGGKRPCGSPSSV